MSNSKSSSNSGPQGGFKMMPFRSMNEFVLDTSKYLAPTFNDLKRFNNRVTSNLLYFQTNYIAVIGFIFVLFLLFGFNKMFYGLFGIASTGAAGLFFIDKIPQLSSIRRQYPFSIYVAAAIDLMLVYNLFRSITFFSLSLLIPILFSIVHASMRSRGIKNKVNNKIDQIGVAFMYATSPMGIVLSTLGFETKDFEE